MSNDTDEALTTYLNDHLAGSVAATQLVERLVESAADGEAGRFFTALRTEIQEDQATLESLLGRLGGAQSGLRQVGGWLTEALGRMKLWLDDPGGGGLKDLEALEVLALGIQGKLALWHALMVIAERYPQLRELDLARLQQRARQQHARVESRRLAVAKTALADTAEPSDREPPRP